MNDQQRRRNLMERLSAAGTAHGEYEATVLHGVYDQQWAEWYANYLLNHGWNEIFKTQWNVSDLTTALERAHFEHRATDAERPWTEFYADRFLEIE